MLTGTDVPGTNVPATVGPFCTGTINEMCGKQVLHVCTVSAMTPIFSFTSVVKTSGFTFAKMTSPQQGWYLLEKQPHTTIFHFWRNDLTPFEYPIFHFWRNDLTPLYFTFGETTSPISSILSFTFGETTSPILSILHTHI
jgi:hypothetical protein